MGRQGKESRLFLGVTVDGALLRLAMDVDIGDVGQSPGGQVVEMGEVAKGPAVEQVLLDEVELPLGLALVCARRGKQAHGLKP